MPRIRHLPQDGSQNHQPL
nr:hypothetical protein [Rhizobium rhizogenes]